MRNALSILAIWIVCYMLYGCATIKNIAEYRQAKQEACACAPCWGAELK